MDKNNEIQIYLIFAPSTSSRSLTLYSLYLSRLSGQWHCSRPVSGDLLAPRVSFHVVTPSHFVSKPRHFCIFLSATCTALPVRANYSLFDPWEQTGLRYASSSVTTYASHSSTPHWVQVLWARFISRDKKISRVICRNNQFIVTN